MLEVTLDEAIVIAEEYLNTVLKYKNNQSEDYYLISREDILDKGSFWLLHYQSKMFLETDNISYALAGNLPLKVSKYGRVMGFAGS